MANDVLKSILDQAKRSQQIIGFRTYKDNGTFWAGYVLDFNDEFVIFQHLSKFGQKDGVNVEELKNIESIETDDDYLNALWLLVDNPLAEQSVRNVELPSGENWQVELLKANPTPSKVVAVDISSDVYVYCIIMEFDNEHFSARCVDNSGGDEGLNVYKVSDINAIQFDSLESRKRQKLYDWNRGGKAR